VVVDCWGVGVLVSSLERTRASLERQAVRTTSSHPAMVSSPLKLDDLSRPNGGLQRTSGSSVGSLAWFYWLCS
jgi:hypothetical protein